METSPGEGTGFSWCASTRWTLSLDNIEELTDFTWAIRRALRDQGITGENGHEIDHIELFGRV